MASWKKNGGINNFDRSGQINIDSLTVNTMSMKHAFKGEFDICGQLVVSGNAIIHDSLKVENDVDIYGDITLGYINSKKIVSVYSDSTFFGNLISKKNFIVDGTITANGNLVTNDNLLIDKSLIFSGGSFLYSSGNALGLNTSTPTAALDISTSLVNSINMYSYNVKNENVLAQNISGQGILLGTDPSSTYIYFYFDNSLNYGNVRNYGNVDAKISIHQGGYMYIDISKNLNIAGPVTIGDNDIHPYNEIFTVYDISQGIFSKDIYKNNTAYTSSSAAYICESNTFIHIGTSNLQGAAIGGGLYPDDIQRSMVTFGITDTSGTYTPAQMIVSGNSVIYPTTTGINTYKPRTDNYVLDVNGPIHIDNGDISSFITNPPFEIFSIDVCTTNRNIVAAVGSSIEVYKDISSNFPKEQVLYTKNNGISWDVIDISNTILKGNTFSHISIYDSKNWFVSGSNNLLINTFDGGNTWQNILTNINNNDYNNVFMNKTGNTISGNVIGYFTFDSSMALFEWPLNTQINKFANLRITSLPTINITSVYANSNTIYISGNNIAKYNASNRTVNQTPQFVSKHSYNDIYNYDKVTCFDNSFSIAVGENIISSTPDGGNTWYDISFDSYFDGSGVFFSSVFIIDTSNAISVGYYGNIWITNNKGISWNPIGQQIFNPSGKYNLLSNTNNFLIDIFMTDLNTFMITSVITPYDFNGDVYGNTQIFSVYSPNFINRVNNFVLDISGCIRMSGDIHINDNGSIKSNNTNFDILSTGVKNINIGEYLTGNTNIRNNMIVSGITTISNTTPSSTSSNGALIVNGGVGINGELNVRQISTFGNINISSTAPSGNSSSGALIVSGGVGVGGNLNIGRTTFLNGNVFITSTTHSANVYSGAFVVSGGVGIQGNLFVQKDSFFNGNLHVYSSTSQNAFSVDGISRFTDIFTTGNIYNDNSKFFIGPSKVSATGSTIFIGGPNDKVVMGTFEASTQQIAVSSDKTVGVNNNFGNATAFGAGINIIDNILVDPDATFGGAHRAYGNIWAYMQIGGDLQSFIFKTPSFGLEGGPIGVGGNSLLSNLTNLSPENRLRVAVNEITFTTNPNIINNGLLVVKRDIDFQNYQQSKGHFYGNDPYNDADTCISICPDFDISNILIKVVDSVLGVQTIGTQLNIGSSDSPSNLTVYGTSTINNSAISQTIFSSPGLVGIGTSSPLVLLDVNGTSRFSGSLSSAGYDTLRFNDNYSAYWTIDSNDVGNNSYFQDIALSYDSQYQYALVYNKTGFGSICRSVNYGSTRTKVQFSSSYAGNIIYQAVPYMNSNITTFRFQDLAGNISLQNAQALNIQIGKYTASASTNASTFSPYFVFDNSNSTYWKSYLNPSNQYDGYFNGSGIYNGVVSTTEYVSNFSCRGEYVQISLPYSFVLTSVLLYSYAFSSDNNINTNNINSHPKVMYILGSNNSVTWYSCTGYTNNNPTEISIPVPISNTTINTPINLTNKTSYSYYRFIVYVTWNGSPIFYSCNITRLDLSGIFQNVTGSFASSIACSGNGQYVTVANQGYYPGTGSLFRSIDYGASYVLNSQTPVSSTWQGIASSYNGSYQAAITINRSGSGIIYLSTNSGSTWTNVLSRPNGWQTISMSFSGQYITAIQTGNVSSPKGNIWVSSDYGTTWKSNIQIYTYIETVNGFLNLGSADFNKTVYVSSSGQYQTALGLAPTQLLGNSNIWQSNNYGVSWVDTGIRAPNNYGTSILSSISMTSSGQNQVVSFIGGNIGLAVPTNNVYGGVLTSYDYGTSWNNRSVQLNSLVYSGNVYYGYLQKIVSSFNGQINFAISKYQDLSSNSYNNNNNTAFNIGNIYLSTITSTSNSLTTQYFGSTHTNTVSQNHGFKISVPTANNSSLMMGYDIINNAIYINSANDFTTIPLSLNTTGANVGIGTITPTYTFDVSGIIQSKGLYSNASTSTFHCGGVNYYNITAISNPPISNGIYSGTGDSNTNTIFNLSIGSWNGTGFIDTYNKVCNIYFDHRGGRITAISFNATSDYRMKDNVANLDDSFTVDNLRPVSYYNKILKKDDIGFIAHEVQEIFPFLVDGEKDGESNQSLNYTGLIGILVKEIQELKCENKSLKERLDAIEARLS